MIDACLAHNTPVDVAHELELLIRARTRLIVIESFDEARVQSMVRRVAKKLNMPLSVIPPPNPSRSAADARCSIGLLGNGWAKDSITHAPGKQRDTGALVSLRR